MDTIESDTDFNTHIDEYIDFQKYWLVLKRRWLPATLTALGIIGLSLNYALSLEEVYKAEGKLLIKNNNTANLTGIENETGTIDRVAPDSDPLATEVEIILSRPIVNKLIQELDLRNDEGELLEYGAVAGPLEVEPVLGTDILDITYKDTDPELAASIVNQLLEVYRDQDTLSNRTQAAAARTFISEQLPQVEANVKQAEARLRQFKNKHQIANLEQETTATIGNLNDLKRQINQLEADLEDIDTRYDRLSSQLGVSWQEASAIALLSQSSAVNTTFAQLQQTKVELAQQSNYLSDNAPQIISLREEIAELEELLEREITKTLSPQQRGLIKDINTLILGQENQGQIVEYAALGLEREGLQKKLVALNNTYQSNQQKSRLLPQLQEEQNELERQVEAAQSTYEILLSQLQETKIAEEQDIGKVRIVSQAVVPEKPIASSTKKIVAAGGVLGTLLGVMVAFLLDIRDNTIKNTKEAEEILPYTLQGVIPKLKGISQVKQRQLRENVLLLTDELLRDDITASSSVKEAYQNIQINLKFAESQEDIKTIAVTSSVAQEGKSSVSANYAVTQAQSGQRVLLVDGDLRRPIQHVLWQISNEVGLSNVLNHEVEWYDVVQNVMPNLDVLTAGTKPENPIHLLDSLFMGILVMKMLRTYDRIIFDTPPLVGLADSKVLGKLVDGVLFVVRPGITNYGSITAARKILETADLNVLGIVANGVDLDAEPYGREYYYPDKKYLKPA